MREKVLRALRQLDNLPGITVSQVMGCGKPETGKDAEADIERQYAIVPKTKLEIVVPDELLESVRDAIVQGAHTGNLGDGKIFIYKVQGVVRIRTDDRVGLETTEKEKEGSRYVVRPSAEQRYGRILISA